MQELLAYGNCEATSVSENGVTYKVYKCPYCPKETRSKSHFVDHIRVHTGERPFACTICGYAFTQKAHFRRHMKNIHNQEFTPVKPGRPFKNVKTEDNL